MHDHPHPCLPHTLGLKLNILDIRKLGENPHYRTELKCPWQAGSIYQEQILSHLAPVKCVAADNLILGGVHTLNTTLTVVCICTSFVTDESFNYFHARNSFFRFNTMTGYSGGLRAQGTPSEQAIICFIDHSDFEMNNQFQI